SAATGTPTPTLQWQLSTNSGGTWSNISGATSASYTTASTVLGDNGKQYRAVYANTCSSGVASNAATLTVSSGVAIGTHPSNLTKCTGDAATFTVAASGAGLTYQ